VELSRNLSQRFNNKYGKTFNDPDVYIAPIGNKILNLRNPNEKMNKSDNGDNMGTIFLMDDLKLVRKKIMSAVTDNEGIVKFDLENKPGVSNLISILSCITNEPIENIEEKFEGKGYAVFKEEVADEVCSLLAKIQENYKEYDNGMVDKILVNGANQARIKASETLIKAKERLGLS
jgi:tryptophanyl-tRNA synthetase